jgi:hypothetical protein
MKNVAEIKKESKKSMKLMNTFSSLQDVFLIMFYVRKKGRGLGMGQVVEQLPTSTRP